MQEWVEQYSRMVLESVLVLEQVSAAVMLLLELGIGDQRNLADIRILVFLLA